jgi:hypothetical protein
MITIGHPGGRPDERERRGETDGNRQGMSNGDGRRPREGIIIGDERMIGLGATHIKKTNTLIPGKGC